MYGVENGVTEFDKGLLIWGDIEKGWVFFYDNIFWILGKGD